MVLLSSDRKTLKSVMEEINICQFTTLIYVVLRDTYMCYAASLFFWTNNYAYSGRMCTFKMRTWIFPLWCDLTENSDILHKPKTIFT